MIKNKEKQGVFLVVLFLCLNSMAQVPFLQYRDVVELNNWQFSKGINNYAHKSIFDDSSWEDVKVPHSYSMDAINNIGYYKGQAWYRTNLNITASQKNKRVFIRFEGVGQEAIVYLNGKKIGKHIGGYSAFCFEITHHIKLDGENVIAVNVSNAPNFKRIPVNDALFNHYGGIYRPVKVFTTPNTNISPNHYASSGVLVEVLEVNKEESRLAVKTHLSRISEQEKVSLNYEVRDEKGELVKASERGLVLVNEDSVITEFITIEKPILWDGKKQPHQYTLKVELSANGERDIVQQKFGIKTFRVDANNGFYLNGKPYQMNGVCKHEEWQQTGPAVTKEKLVKDMELINEIGAKALRLSHYQHSDKTYELADEKGILIWAEIPFVHDWSGREGGNAKQQLKELILQNYNHPSIFVWGLWNEVRAWNGPKTPSVVLTKELKKIAHHLDKSRLTISASDRGMESDMEGITDLQSWNKYYGWYSSSVDDLGKWLDESHKNYPDIEIGISEYGAGGNIKHQDLKNIERPKGNCFPEQYQAEYHEKSWKIIKDRPFVWSSFVWNMFDFSVAGWNRGGIKNLNHKGLVTFDRKTKKDAFYFYKANWSDVPVLYIAERRHNKRTEANTYVKVYTNLNKVTLAVNGKQVAIKKLTSDIGVIIFDDVQLKKGVNIVEVLSKDKLKLKDSIEWILED